MSLQIGRITGLPEPLSWASTGDRHVTVTGNYRASSVSDGLIKRDQLLSYGLPNADEPVVPVIMDNEPRINGYYRILGTSVTTDEFTRKSGNLYDYRVDLETVPTFSQPIIESIVSGALLTNAVGAITGDMMYFHSVPSVATEYWRGGGGGYYTRSSADGNLLWATSGSVSDTARYYLAPGDYYTGACRFEQGSPLQVVIGRLLVQPDVVNWRISNGLVRITPNATSGKIDVAHWTGATWATVKTYRFTGTTTAGIVNGFKTLTLLRNSPEEVVVRLSCTVAFGINWGRVNIDLALRRGDRIVRGYLTSDAQSTYQVAREVTEAATAITYGSVTLGNIRATSNDGDGNRYVLMSVQTANPTSDLVNGKITQPFATQSTMDFGIGSEIGGSGAGIPNRAVDIAQQYLAAQSETQHLVAR